MSDVRRWFSPIPVAWTLPVILKWLQDTYNCEVVTFTADLGQGEEVNYVQKHKP